MNFKARKASALIMALWTIAILSIIVLSFAFEARIQSGVNVYIRERSSVNRLIDSGKVLAEVVLSNYSNVSEWSEDEETEKIIKEDDRWLLEKRQLKMESKCTIGPIILDERRDEKGELVNPSTVKVDIELVSGGDKNAININELYSGCGDESYRLRWEMILMNHGLDPEFEAEDDDGNMVVLSSWLIACWNDWRDKDNDVSNVDDALGAESDWYKAYDDDHDIDEEDRLSPRNGSIPNIEELSYVRGFRTYPSILRGGLLYPDEKESESNPRLKPIVDIFGVYGNTKVNPNTCNVDQLLTVPGIFDEEDFEEGRAIAEAIVAGRNIEPENTEGVDLNRKWWPYKDFDDLISRVAEDIGQAAKNYLFFQPEKESVFKIKITCQSMGMVRIVNAKGYVNDKKIRYIEWREE
jgi:hypothetical protein